MTTRFVLVRHATCAQTHDVLLGRQLDAALDDGGAAQADSLGRWLAAEPLDLIVHSPRRRTRQTARAIARHQHCPVEPQPAFDEVDFGEWGGCTFDALAADPRWQRWNRSRASAATPAGDDMHAVLRRAHACMARYAKALPAASIAVVTHAEVIRAVLLDALGRSFDAFASLDVPPASMSLVRLGRDGVRVEALPRTVAVQTTSFPVAAQEPAR